jgi:hypothetical protein
MAHKVKKSKWKETHWDKWSFWHKVRHVIAVPVGIITIIGMWAGAAYVLFIYFGLLGFFMTVRDEVLLKLAHWLFD